jgi:DNA-binding XRE family transcriptional regulator
MFILIHSGWKYPPFFFIQLVHICKREYNKNIIRKLKYKCKGGQRVVKIKANIDKIIELRIKKGFNVADMARKAGVTRQAIYQLEKRNNNIGPKLAAGIAMALETDFDELFTIEINRGGEA